MPAPVANTQTPARVQIVFRGATKFKESELREALGDQIEEIKDSGLTPAAADDAAFFLGLFYHNHGYSQANVKSAINGDSLALDVSEGPLTQVEEVTFTGNKSIPSAKLRDYMIGAT